MNKRLWIGVVILIGLFFVSALCYKNSVDNNKNNHDYVSLLNPHKVITKDDIIKAREQAESTTLSSDEKNTIIGDHTLGKKNAKVIVIAYEDFACPHCQEFNSYAKKIYEDYGNRVTFIFRSFNLNFPNSIATIGAAEAAGLVGGEAAYWKMNDQLFASDKWLGYAVTDQERDSLLNEYAKAAKINVDDFNAALQNANSNGITNKIKLDRELAKSDGVQGTPTWIVNGKAVDSVNDQDIRKAIDQALKDNGQD